MDFFDFNNNEELDAFDLCMLDEIENDAEEDKINDIDNILDDNSETVLFDFEDDVVIEKD